MKSFAVALLVSLVMALAGVASAGTYVVNTEADFPHAALNTMPDPGDPGSFNECVALFTPGGPCTLRAAVQAANANPGPDTITFMDPGFAQTYTLSASGANEDSAVLGDLDIRCSVLGDCSTEKLTIIGNGKTDTMIDGGVGDRIFDVVDAEIELEIQTLTLQKGNTTSPSPADGSAVRNAGSLTLNDVTVKDSVADVTIDGGTGLVADADGAVLNLATMTLTDVEIRDNTGDGLHAADGTVTATNLQASGNTVAAVRVLGDDAVAKIEAASVLTANSLGFWVTAGRLMLSDCTISLNAQTITNGTDPAGGGFNEAGFTTINGCDIIDNTSRTGGGGIRNSGTLELVNSRIEGNAVSQFSDSGGGLLNRGGRAVVRGSLFTDNTADFGAGIFNVFQLTLVNTTVSGNNGPGLSTRDDGALEADVRIFSSTLVQNQTADLNQTSTANLIEVRSSVIEICDVTAGTDVITSLGYNFESAFGCNFTDSTDEDGSGTLVGTVIAALADNGGPTHTHATIPMAMPDAVGHNTDTNRGCPLIDQRGFSRPLGACDVGAFQLGDFFQCNDGLDNDLDGNIDLADSGCLNATDNRELTIGDGDIFVASDEAAGVFVLPADYVNPNLDPGPNPLPAMLTRGTGLVGPYSVRGFGRGDGIEDPNLDGERDGIRIVIVDALQGLLFEVDLETGLPWIFGSTGGLDFPRDLVFADDGDVFAAGASVTANEAVVRVDAVTGRITDVTHPSVGGELVVDDVLGLEWDPDTGSLLASQFLGTDGAGIYRVDPDTGDVTQVDQGSEIDDPRGLFRRRTGDLLAAQRGGSDDDVIEVDLSDGSELRLDVPGLSSPRGIGLFSEQAEIIDVDPEVVVRAIVSERSNGILHEVIWRPNAGPAVATEADFAEDLPNMYHVWVLHDQDSDGLFDDQEDSDGDGLTDDFETNTGILLDNDHPGTDPNNGNTDGDVCARCNDGDELIAGTDPNDSADYLFAEGIPALGPYGALLLGPLLLVAARLTFRRRA